MNLSVQSMLLSPSKFEKFLQISVKIECGPLEHVIQFICLLINFFYENNALEVVRRLQLQACWFLSLCILSITAVQDAFQPCPPLRISLL